MTPEDRANLRALLAAATPGPWTQREQQDRKAWRLVFGEQKDVAHCPPWAGGEVEANAELICALRNNAEALLDAAEGYAREIELSEGHPAMCCGQCIQAVDNLRTRLAGVEAERDEARGVVLGLVVAQYRDGWEDGASEAETRQSALDALYNWGLDPHNDREKCERLLGKTRPSHIALARSNQELRETAYAELRDVESENATLRKELEELRAGGQHAGCRINEQRHERRLEDLLGLLRELRDAMAHTLQTCPRGALQSAEMRAMKQWVQVTDERLAQALEGVTDGPN